MVSEEITAKIAGLGSLKDKPVTWGDLFEVLYNMNTEIAETIQAANKCQDTVIDGLSHYVLELYNEAEYRRMRSMCFVLAITYHTDPSKWRPIYDWFCKEYDKLNRKE